MDIYSLKNKTKKNCRPLSYLITKIAKKSNSVRIRFDISAIWRMDLTTFQSNGLVYPSFRKNKQTKWKLS